ncbi:hypothetical protein CLAFUW4_12669 [Fulvia fulva]|uniref:Tat pathway signal sequence n=1 Tax=Passalora fulva TaxID=5499 RepID=A0A9Q8PJI3_PASFU|nr:uncharacterized protein CLAFUR5_12537 [Fulvia fulva]KAK4611990.1 hypothetical protein CLAFUR4_12674 [Fulvia fulva]UJO23587.1 hypothetical protein CLAFUR5_12537 [Fulvia fulva]WPV21598.1 hypothetical protein CLAFUW4_12669 [Fulvia fulva]WPV35833.1 hypothetical protein CLAFUW7_12676 [Fulvia fulva]
MITAPALNITSPSGRCAHHHDMSEPEKHQSKQSLVSDTDTDVEDRDSHLQHYRPRSRPRPFWRRLWLDSLFFVAIFLATRAYYVHPSWNKRLEMADVYSPLYRDFDQLHVDQVLTGEELWSNGSNPYRQDPSPAVDDAWHKLSHPKYMLVTEEELIKMGKPIEPVVRWPDEPDKFLMHLNGPHVMHCLDVLRRNAYHNFPHYHKDDETLNAIHWTHWGHCLEIIRQELHCRPSMHLNSMVWQEGQEVFYPDFHTQKRCVRWDDLEEMLSRRIIPFEDMLYAAKHYLKPDDAVQRHTPAEGWEVIDRNHEWITKMTEKGYKITGDH